jgi:hypothetical protein
MLKTDIDRKIKYTNKIKKSGINRLLPSYEQIKKIIAEHNIYTKEQYCAHIYDSLILFFCLGMELIINIHVKTLNVFAHEIRIIYN